jgi:2-C-methyl-D-erythritol 2,4-cyclodiphosphate synthase
VKFVIKIGSSIDVHQLVAKRKLILGGINIPSKLGAKAHSDGDVVFHAITEAIIGALAKGDLGDYFPPTDPQYKNYDSSKFVLKAMELLKKEKYQINNVDITIILQDPKLGKNKVLIRDNIVKLMKLKKDQVNVKAGTAEKLGDIGKGKGVISFVTLLIEKVG